MVLTDKELKQVYDGLQAGKLYRPMRDNGVIDNYYHVVRGWNNIDKTEHCLMYTYAGSSAKANTLEGLRWISEVIFKDFNKWVEA